MQQKQLGTLLFSQGLAVHPATHCLQPYFFTENKNSSPDEKTNYSHSAKPTGHLR